MLTFAFTLRAWAKIKRFLVQKCCVWVVIYTFCCFSSIMVRGMHVLCLITSYLQIVMVRMSEDKSNHQSSTFIQYVYFLYSFPPQTPLTKPSSPLFTCLKASLSLFAQINLILVWVSRSFSSDKYGKRVCFATSYVQVDYGDVSKIGKYPVIKFYSICLLLVHLSSADSSNKLTKHSYSLIYLSQSKIVKSHP